MPEITGYHHLSLTVRDVDVSERFYADVLGFVRVFNLEDTKGHGYKRVMAHPGSRTILGFSVHQGNDGSAFSEFRTGLDHLALGVPSRAALDEWTARLDELGVEHSDVHAEQFGEFISLRDPDGVQIELWADPGT